MEFSKKIYNYTRYPFVYFCVNNGITANMITYFNHFITCTLGVYFFSLGTYIGGLLGLLIMFINGYLDYLDGDIAKQTGQCSKLGEWIDSGFDVVIQNIIMGAISIGCYKMGMPLFWIVLFYISNSGCNLVSFHFNNTFGFNSASGNKLFRDYMDNKPNLFNKAIKNLIDPTSSMTGLFILTFRYWIIIGVIFNIMPICFILLTIINNLKWFIMFVIYGMHQKQYQKLWVNQALAILDQDRKEYYAIRGCK